MRAARDQLAVARERDHLHGELLVVSDNAQQLVRPKGENADDAVTGPGEDSVFVDLKHGLHRLRVPRELVHGVLPVPVRKEVQHALLRPAHDRVAALDEAQREQLVLLVLRLGLHLPHPDIVQRQGRVAARGDDFVPRTVHHHVRNNVVLLLKRRRARALPHVPHPHPARVVPAHKHVGVHAVHLIDRIRVRLRRLPPHLPVHVHRHQRLVLRPRHQPRPARAERQRARCHRVVRQVQHPRVPPLLVVAVQLHRPRHQTRRHDVDLRVKRDVEDMRAARDRVRLQHLHVKRVLLLVHVSCLRCVQ